MCSVIFKDPQYPLSHVFEAKLLPGATLPDKVLKPGGMRGGRGSWTPRTSFRTPTHHSYNTPDPPQRMLQ